MKTLSNHSLLFDRDCPLCRWYTGLFLKYQLLDSQGRVAYQDIDETVYPNVDFELARNKIALVNRNNGHATYGIDGLIAVLGNRFTIIKMIAHFKPIHWLLDQLYQLISYNRKIVIPVSCSQSGSCNPSRNWAWRLLFILICAFTVNGFVNLYFQQHLSAYFIGNPVWGDSALFMGQLLFQSMACYLLNEMNVYDYLGHLSFISFLGAIMLGAFGLGLNIFHSFGMNISMLEPLCYGIVFAWMFIEHRRRIKIAEMNVWLTLTWLLYRFMIYPIAFSIT